MNLPKSYLAIVAAVLLGVWPGEGRGGDPPKGVVDKVERRRERSRIEIRVGKHQFLTWILHYRAERMPECAVRAGDAIELLKPPEDAAQDVDFAFIIPRLGSVCSLPFFEPWTVVAANTSESTPASVIAEPYADAKLMSGSVFIQEVVVRTREGETLHGYVSPIKSIVKENAFIMSTAAGCADLKRGETIELPPYQGILVRGTWRGFFIRTKTGGECFFARERQTLMKSH